MATLTGPDPALRPFTGRPLGTVGAGIAPRPLPPDDAPEPPEDEPPAPEPPPVLVPPLDPPLDPPPVSGLGERGALPPDDPPPELLPLPGED